MPQVSSHLTYEQLLWNAFRVLFRFNPPKTCNLIFVLTPYDFYLEQYPATTVFTHCKKRDLPIIINLCPRFVVLSCKWVGVGPTWADECCLYSKHTSDRVMASWQVLVSRMTLLLWLYYSFCLVNVHLYFNFPNKSGFLLISLYAPRQKPMSEAKESVFSSPLARPLQAPWAFIDVTCYQMNKLGGRFWMMKFERCHGWHTE